MPTYRFQCYSCGLNFSARAAATASTQSCTCGATASRDLPSGNAHVGFKTTGAECGPTTTGFSGVDYEAERAIGAYSDHKWDEIRHRTREKEDIIRETGVTGHDLTRRPDGSYGVMHPQERAASERTRNWHHAVMRHHPDRKT